METKTVVVSIVLIVVGASMWGVVCINELYKMPFVIEICQDEDFLKYTHNGIGTEEDPFIIEDEHIGGSETSGIKIENTTKYFEIRNCQIEVDTTGIFIQNIEAGTVRISENICKGGMIGIKVKNADSIIIDNNICKNNYDTGIVLESSEKCVILNNSCQENELGIHLVVSSENLVINNILEKNLWYGMKIDNGFFLYSESNKIYENYFYFNNEDKKSQAFDKGKENMWYNPITYVGNYWSDWDENDEIYEIDGQAENVDPYPILTETEKVRGENILLLFVTLLTLVYIRKKHIKKSP
ncbi:hypothetical protein ES708_20775 [subsurface metagenome]